MSANSAMTVLRSASGVSPVVASGRTQSAGSGVSLRVADDRGPPARWKSTLWLLIIPCVLKALEFCADRFIVAGMLTILCEAWCTSSLPAPASGRLIHRSFRATQPVILRSGSPSDSDHAFVSSYDLLSRSGKGSTRFLFDHHATMQKLTLRRGLRPQGLHNHTVGLVNANRPRGTHAVTLAETPLFRESSRAGPTRR